MGCACACVRVSVCVHVCVCMFVPEYVVCVLCMCSSVCGGQWLTSAVFVVLHLMFLRLDLVGELAVSARLADKHLPGSACLSASSPY